MIRNNAMRFLLTLAALVFASTVCASIPKVDRDWSSHFADAENRLIAVASNGTPIASYQYNSENRRISKTVGDTTHQYTYDGWNVVAEKITSPSSSILNLYIWGADINGSLDSNSGGVRGLLCILSSDNGQQPTAYYPVMNNHGDVMALFDASGTSIVAKYERDPFGVLLSATGPAANVCPFGFQTKYYDAETGLYYINHRYYSPVLGRFISRDPKQEAGGVNLYSYGKGNPFKVDGLGLDPEHNTSANEATASISLDALFPPQPVMPSISAYHPTPQMRCEYDIAGNYYLSSSSGQLFNSLAEARRAGCLDAIEAPPATGNMDDYRYYFARTGQWGEAGKIKDTQAALLMLSLMPLPGRAGKAAAIPLERAAVAGVERRIAAKVLEKEYGVCLFDEQIY